ncbi:MAG: hypothetical protein OEO23_02125 [Gemmatimonadota bacterium]|nr:hypothetical protein [Gemmatimonadota bacterium]
MTKTRTALAALMAAFLVNCTDPTGIQDQPLAPSGNAPPPSQGIVDELPAVCGVATTPQLIAGKTVPVGLVEVTHDGTDLYVTYRTEAGWPILRTALFLGSAPTDIRQTKSGNPRVGHFPYDANHPGLRGVTWQIDLSS